MTTMIELVARAMAAADSGPEGCALFDIHWAEFGECYLSSARAVIAAMREPTDLMGVGISKMGADYRPGSHSATQLWREMIDAALEEKL